MHCPVSLCITCTCDTQALHQLQGVAFREVVWAVQKQKGRIDAFLSVSMPEISRNRIKQSILGGLVAVNGKLQLKPSYSIHVGDKVRFEMPPPATTSASPEDIPLQVVYEDEAVIVVNKAAGGSPYTCLVLPTFVSAAAEAECLECLKP